MPCGGGSRWSSRESLLTVLCAALLLVCVGLATVAWIALQPPSVQDQLEETDSVLRGRMVITRGGVFTEELRNKTSVQFKALAFDTQQLISEAFGRGSLSDLYKACHVLDFSQGSVVVTFDLRFHQRVEAREAELQLGAGLQGSDGGLVIDRHSIHITDIPTTAQPSSTGLQTTAYTTAPPTTPGLQTTAYTTAPPTTPGLQTTAYTTAPPTTPGLQTTAYTTAPPTTPGLQTTAYTTAPPTTSGLQTTAYTTAPPTTSVVCGPYQMACGDGFTCVPTMQFCDGVADCPDGSDENPSVCATKCDGQFVLLGPSGWFHSENFPLPYNNGTVCRWIIRVQRGLAIKIDFQSFHTEEGYDLLMLYEGTGQDKILTYTLSGLSPGTAWLTSDEATAEFSSDDVNQLPGFNASFSAHSITNLSNEEKLRCSFEDGFCFWRQDVADDGDWTRSSGPAFPPFTGPDSDHTTGNQSGHYIVTPTSPGQWEKSFQIRSLPLTQMNESVCLRFWYHMYGEDVRRLRVLLDQRVGSVVGDEGSVTVVFQKEGNYGDNWNSGQVTVGNTTSTVGNTTSTTGNTTSTTGNTTSTTVVFEAQKRGGTRNDIALDDISMSPGPCEDGPPEPTLVPTPTTPPPMPPDCGGPFDLWEPDSVFSSPNYPHSYGNKANCLWTLHAKEGYNIQLHFLDFDVEAISDMVEVRDGAGPQSELLGVFTGSYAPSPDVISTANQMTVMFFTDSSVSGRGFHANFTTGLGLGMPKPCSSGQHQCMSGECISNSSVCDSRPDCSDASDEAHCVHLRGNGSSHQRLQLQVQSSLYTACAHNWTTQMSNFACRYLGYRSGDALPVPVRAEDSPFVTVLITHNSTDLAFSETCVGEKVVSLLCDNQPCGVRLVDVRSGDSSAPEPGREDPGKIVGGVNSQKGAWPWIVSLHWRGRHVCGASLIDNEWLVTAAHCVYGKNVHLSSWKAVLGLHSQDGTDSAHTHVLSIDRVVMSRHYNRRTKEADVAMMHLHTRVLFTDYIQPVCLPRSQQQFEAGRKCVIAGWGRVAEQGWVANVLQQATLPLLDRPACQRLLPEYNISASMVCAGLPEGGVDSCQGDSGGPLMCEEDGHWVLVGVTSFGIGCGRPQRPGVYALVSQFTDWIVQIRRFPDAGKTET